MAKAQKGNFLLFGALGLAGLVLFAGSFFLFGKKDLSAEENMQKIFEAGSYVRKSYQDRADYWGFDGKALSSEFLQNSYGKKVLAGQGFEGALSMPGARSFDIVYQELDRGQCMKMLTVPLRQESSLGLIRILLKNEAGEAEFSWGGANGLPVDLAEAKALCGTDNSILWTFE